MTFILRTNYIGARIGELQGVLKKTHFQNAAGATVHWLNHHLPAPLVPGLQTLEIDILVVSY